MTRPSPGAGAQRTVTGSGRLSVQNLKVDAPLGRLSVVYPPELKLSFTLGSSTLTLGRDPGDASPPLDEPTVSRRHLAVEWDADQQTRVAVDLGSRNGSRVDGQPLTGRRPVQSGAVLRVGHVLLVYESAPVGSRLPWVDDPGPAVSRSAIPGESAGAFLLRSAVGRAAPDPSPALVVGETGTGKELCGAEMHRLSGRTGALVTLNCAALSPHLIESQLFGHLRGAFTGAEQAHAGLVRAADGGTLFLDEIGELPLPLQAKLLRLIQEREVQPVGSPRPIKVDVRIIAATNRDLAAGAESGAFRRDLYARLAMWEIKVPSLRERRTDILSWVDRLHARWLAERGRTGAPLQFEPGAAEALLLHPWPENLRGIDRMVHELALEGGPFDAGDLPEWLLPASSPRLTESAPPGRPAPTREELEAVLRARGSVAATAKYFGRDRRQIYRWMDALGIDRAGK